MLRNDNYTVCEYRIYQITYKSIWYGTHMIKCRGWPIQANFVFSSNWLEKKKKKCESKKLENLYSSIDMSDNTGINENRKTMQGSKW